MENYIVRIYRRDASDPNKVAGVFESVEQETENTFTSLKALFSLLSAKPAGDDRENAERPVRSLAGASSRVD